MSEKIYIETGGVNLNIYGRRYGFGGNCDRAAAAVAFEAIRWALEARRLEHELEEPDAFYYPDKRITFKVRDANNVLGKEDWPIISITLLEERIVRLNVMHMGVCSLPGFRLWDGMADVLEWLLYDGTGQHPEQEHEIYDPVEREWCRVGNMEDFVEILSTCYRHGHNGGGSSKR